ncbi:MAG: LysM peptidoglycan-binding domain-containing protein [Deltaproteobacteria bacterium]|nr:LysM peptidoglycan-binding domain-containing protein [Deltaproteobacteria bacterium]
MMKIKLIFMLMFLLSFSVYSHSLAVERERHLEDGEYTVLEGDTLWDISDSFLRNPFKWPSVWKINPYIVNPHLIYPGNKIRLFPSESVEAGEKAKEGGVEAKPTVPKGLPIEKLQKPEDISAAVMPKEAEVPPTPSATEEKPAPKIIKVSSLIMERHGLISAKDKEGIGIIIGSKEEKLLLSQGDIVYISIAKGNEIKEGENLTIFTITGEVKHPVTDKPVGFLTDTSGVLKIIKVETGGVIIARIEKSYKEILKGAKLKSHEPPVIEVEVKKPEKVIDGFIIASIEGKVGLAESDIVYLDKGKNSGLEQGNTMNIFRPTTTVSDPMSKEEKTITFPPAELGKLVIIRAEEDTSTAFITKSRQVIYKGDRVRTAE